MPFRRMIEIHYVKYAWNRLCLSIMYGGTRGDYMHEFSTAVSGKNEIEKTIIQKRNENENENTFKNDK